MCTSMINRANVKTEDRQWRRPICGDRRFLRALYRAIKSEIAEGKGAFSRVDSDSFDHILGNVEHLHNEVSRPSEQMADAEARRFDITASLLASVKDIKRGGGRTTSEFVTAIIKNFGRNAVATTDEKIKPMIDWERLGHEARAIFSEAPGMTTMLGPMESQPKQRKMPQRRQRDRPT